MDIPSVSNCARFYVLPKIHKPTLAFRPTVSDVGTASYKLAHFYLNFLLTGIPLNCEKIL